LINLSSSFFFFFIGPVLKNIEDEMERKMIEMGFDLFSISFSFLIFFLSIAREEIKLKSHYQSQKQKEIFNNIKRQR